MIKKMSKEVSKNEQILDRKEYINTLAHLKQRVLEAQLKAAFSVNRELLKLYWEFGKIIVDRQEKNGWGANIVEKLAEDMQKLFPGIAGFSRSNIFNMRSFYLTYEKVQQAVGQFEMPIFNISWSHNIVLIQKLKNNDQRLWYADKTIEYGWSRYTLQDYIKSDIYKREGKAISNFKEKLPSPYSQLAQDITKDPYIFDFLTLQEEHLEKDLEQGLIDNVQKTLLEMGKGFALVGRQYHLHVADIDYYLDLLFYHLKLRCYVVVELKACEFRPEHAGKLNFYLAVVDDLVKGPEDKETIGLILCKTKSNILAEYALRGFNKPIGVAEYQAELIKTLPKELKGTLPTVEELEAEFEKNAILNEIDNDEK